MNNRSERTTIWITGAGGLIGSYTTLAAGRDIPGANVIALTRAGLDLLDFNAVRTRHAADRPDIIVHCAALSRSPDCQGNPDLARRMNVGTTQTLCDLAEESVFVFLSSDLIFDGRNPPYNEESRPNPLSIYAETKLEAEEIVRKHPRHLIVRTSLNGGDSPTRDRGFNEQMRMAWEAGRELPLFVDEFRCPIHASETARSICNLLSKNLRGTFHIAGAERISRYDLGRLVAQGHQRLNPRIRPASSREHPGPPRPADLDLNITRAEAAMERKLPRISDWLAQNLDSGVA